MSIVDSLRKLSLKLTGAYSTGEDIEDNIEYIAENYSGVGGSGEPSGVVTATIVESLPDNGVEDKLYLVLSDSEEHIYNEYIWSNGVWVNLGPIHVEIDVEEITELKEDLSGIATFSDVEYDEVITQDSNVLTLYGNGSVSSVGGRYVSNESYETYLWIPSESIDIYIERNGGTVLRIVEYNAVIETLPSSNTNVYFVRSAVYESGTNNLPTSNNRWTVPAGHMVAITRINSSSSISDFTLYYSATTEIKSINDDVVLPDTVIENTNVFNSLKKMYLNATSKEISHATKSGTTVIVDEDGAYNFSYEDTYLTSVTGANQFNISEYSFTPNSSSTDATVTPTATGVRVVSNDTGSSNRFVYFNFTAPYTGRLWISAIASCVTDKTNDLRLVVLVNGTEMPPSCVGSGLLKRYVDVTAEDTVQVRLWYHLYTSSETNTVEYSNIMIAYADCPFEAYVYPATTNNPRKGAVMTFSTATSVEYDYYAVSDVLNVVCFGDSITGMFDCGADYCTMMENISPVVCANVGFSGTTWTDHPSTHYIPFSLNRLVESIVSSDFSYQDAHIESITSNFYSEHLTVLEAIDFADVDVVTFLAGTNDWAFNVALTSEDDPSESNKQRTNIEDAVKYCITQMLTAFPHLTTLVMTPYWRSIDNSVDNDSDTDPNDNGVYLYEVANTIESVASSKNVQCENIYHSLGANMLTRFYYTIDGTHPNTRTKKVIAERFCKMIERSGLM